MNRRSALAIAVLTAAVLLLAGQLLRAVSDPRFWPPDDFVEYWCAGWLNLRGENPYDPARMYALEQEIGWDIGQAVMMWNPPWTLSLTMPLGLLQWRVAQFVWFLVKLGILVYCADRLWRVYGGPVERVWVAWAVTFGFVPTLVALHVGQISPFLLLGATLFVTLEKSGRPVLAGAACVLLAAKPHLAYLFWLAVAVDAVAMRRPGFILGGALGGVAASLWPLAENPAVFEQYSASLRDHPPAQWMSLTAGTLLRIVFGPEHFWLQFVPMVPGVAWFVYDGYANGLRNRAWADRVPWLLFVSFVTAPYGAWPYDLVLLLVPVIALTTRLAGADGASVRLPAAIGFAAVNLAMLAINASEVKSVWLIWVAPVLFLLALAIHRRLAAPPRRLAAA